ncbi:MAG TPA: hypothetical protein VNZ22_10865 [Bacillota bacterium]|nr:hypothetical protein [Bacillota bacterium]
MLLFVLRRFAAHDVRNAPVQLWFYLSLGAAWVGLVERLSLHFGLSARDDVFERHNAAAGIALCGLLVGSSIAFAGANVGEGSGWYAVVFCAALSTGGLLLAWWALDAITEAADTISIDRDLATGTRTAGFFCGCGLILGGAVAGDWHSLGGTVIDFFKYGWPVALLWMIAAVIERFARPTPAQPAPAYGRWGVLPALLYLGIGVLVAWVGWQ